VGFQKEMAILLSHIFYAAKRLPNGENGVRHTIIEFEWHDLRKGSLKFLFQLLR
jgi:hypothetical protein